MLRFGIVFLTLACILGAQPKQQQKKYKGPEVEVLEVKAHREEGRVKLDGRVRNCGVRPIRGLVLVFDFMAPGKAVITTQKIITGLEELEPGGEYVFRGELTDPVRAVRLQLAAVDERENDLRIAKPGPYVIE
jgi:hypothetical protein